MKDQEKYWGAFIKSSLWKGIYISVKGLVLTFSMRVVIAFTLGLFVGFLLWMFKFSPIDWIGVLVLSIFVAPVFKLESMDKEGTFKK